MKRERYIIIIIALMCILFTWSVVKCAQADHWTVKSSLLPGTYMLTYMSVETTDRIHQMYDYYGELDLEPATNIIYTGYMVVFGFNEKYNSEALAEFLNAAPSTPPDLRPELFKLEDAWWRQIPLPIKWLKGDVVM